MDFIPISKQYQSLKTEIDEKVLAAMARADFIMGSEVYELEEKLAAYVGVRHAISCGSGTDALQLIFLAYGIGKGDAVFCPDMTFIASIEPACLLGAVPVFCDIEQTDYTISPASLERQIQAVIQEQTYTPKAIVAVDFLGTPAKWQELSNIAKKYDLLLIEDAAQSMSAVMDGKKCGSFGDIAATSFFPTKPLGAFGDGGAVFTNDDVLADVIRSLQQHGKGRTKYINERIGINSRLDNLQAAVLNVKLKYLDQELAERQKRAKRYLEQIENVRLPIAAKHVVSAYAQFVICLDQENTRDRMQQYLHKRGIPTLIYYPNPLHLLPVFQDSECYGEGFCAASAYGKTNLGLPFSPYLSDQEQDTVIESVHSFFEEEL